MRFFLNRVGLPGQLGLVNKKIIRLQKPSISRDQIARRQQHHIARHQCTYSLFAGCAVTQHRGHHRDLQGQLLGCTTRPVGLHEVQRDTHHHNQTNDERSSHIARERRDAAGGQEHQHQRIAKMCQKLQHDSPLQGLFEHI